jgi:hypothetical protein
MPPGPNGNGHVPRRTQRVPPGPVPPPVQVAPLGVLSQQYEAMVAANTAKLAELQRQGVGLDPFTFVHARIDMLIDSIAQFAGPDGPRWSMLTRLAFEQHIATELASAEREGRKVQLTPGTGWTPSMIHELARQTGTQRRT